MSSSFFLKNNFVSMCNSDMIVILPTFRTQLWSITSGPTQRPHIELSNPTLSEFIEEEMVFHEEACNQVDAKACFAQSYFRVA